MTDVDRAIEMLKSPDFHKRQEGCEELGAATSLSKEAIDALTKATSDRFDPVAEAAARALAVHQPSVAGVQPPDSLLELIEEVRQVGGEVKRLRLIIVLGLLILIALVWWKADAILHLMAQMRLF